MIIIKSFLRCKTTKVYVLLSIIMMIIISLLKGFSNYYDDLINSKYVETSYFYTEDYNLFNKINKNKYGINNIEKALFLNIDNLIFNDIFQIDTNILFNQKDEHILVYKDSGLNSNDFVITIPQFQYDMILNEINDDQSIYLNIKGNLEKIHLLEYKKDAFSSILVSNELYEKIDLDDNVIYLFDIDNYLLKDEFLGSYNNIKYIQNFETNSQYDTLVSLEKTLKILKRTCGVIYIVFSMLFMLIIYDILKDEFYKMKNEWMMGFSVLKIKKILFIKLCVFVLISLLFSLFIFGCLIIIFKSISINLFINSYNFILIILIFAIISFIPILFIKRY